jgi:transposase
LTNQREHSEELRAAIRIAYQEGEEAVIALVESLLQAQSAVTSKLEARLEALENQTRKDSKNSSKPPSGDGFGKRTQSQRVKSKRQPGGQPGHPGSTLEWVEEPDCVEQHRLTHCQGCGASLDEQSVVAWHSRQVHDLVPITLQVSEHQAAHHCCRHCGQYSQAPFPVGVSQHVQYGAGLRSVMVYLMDYQLLPSARVKDLLSEVFGCQLSEGTLYTVRQDCFDALSEVDTQIKRALQDSEVAHFDETGLRVNGKLRWLHVASTPRLTHYVVHPKRGREGIDAMEILPHFAGVGVHDGWSSYASYGCAHALCNAHHLRELRFIVERYAQTWAELMSTLLVTMKEAVEQAKAQGQTQLSMDMRFELERQYRALVAEGLRLNPPNLSSAKARGRPKQSPARNLLERLDKHRIRVLRFLHDFRVPFDNNQAERDIRMMKLKQKISGGFRSPHGAQLFCRIRGYLSTLNKQGHSLLRALEQVFQGQPVIPSLLPE